MSGDLLYGAYAPIGAKCNGDYDDNDDDIDDDDDDDDNLRDCLRIRMPGELL